MSRRDVSIGAACMLVMAAAFVASLLIATPAPKTARDAIAALPGVGYGWLDTLERVVGPVLYDSTNAIEEHYEGPELLGMYESEHGLISIQLKPIAYSRYQRHYNADVCRAYAYVHPVEIAGYAPGTVAHEFGHLFQFRLQPHEVPQLGDTLPDWADDTKERFADRFARAMLALRGWADPDTTDKVLNNRVRYLLLRSYWTKE